MILYPQFKKALWKWVNMSHKLLLNEPHKTLSLSKLFRNWELGDDGNYRVSTNHVEWAHEAIAALLDLPEFGELQRAVDAYPNLGRHVNTLVGTTHGAMRWELPQIAARFLARPKLSDDDTRVTLHTEKSFSVQYREFEVFLNAELVSRTVIWPMSGIVLDHEYLMLERGILIRRLKEDEILACISAGIINPMFPGVALISGNEVPTYCLAYTYEVSKVVGETGQQDSVAVDTTEKLKKRIPEDLLAAVAVLGWSNVSIYGWIEITDMGTSYSTHGYTRSNLRSSSRKVLKQQEIRLLKKTWLNIRRVGNDANHALYLGARRLAFSLDRIREEDRILDLLISAEALYLSSISGKGRGELQYRLALRAAYWADPANIRITRRDVFKLMKKAYDVRSDVAHGGLVEPGSHELIEQVSLIISQGLRKAFQYANKSPNHKFEPAWDDLIIQ